MAWWKKKTPSGEEQLTAPPAEEPSEELVPETTQFPTRKAAREARELDESSVVPFAALSEAAQERQSHWERLGRVTRLDRGTRLANEQAPSSRQSETAVSFLAISIETERTLLATDGLSEPPTAAEGSAGLATELFLAGEVTHPALSQELTASAPLATLPSTTQTDEAALLWQLGALRGLAHLLLEAGVDLAPRLATYGAMTLPLSGVGAPPDWLNESGELGLLVGLPHPLVPATLSVGGNAVNLIGVAPLRPAELKHVQGHGEAARRKLATALVSLGPARLSAPNRLSLIPYTRPAQPPTQSS